MTDMDKMSKWRNVALLLAMCSGMTLAWTHGYDTGRTSGFNDGHTIGRTEGRMDCQAWGSGK